MEKTTRKRRSVGSASMGLPLMPRDRSEVVRATTFDIESRVEGIVLEERIKAELKQYIDERVANSIAASSVSAEVEEREPKWRLMANRVEAEDLEELERYYSVVDRSGELNVRDPWAD